MLLDVSCAGVAEATGLFTRKRIIVGLRWYALPVEERVAVLYHEAWHCLAWHMEKRILMLPLLLLFPGFVTRICQRQELDCDRFAAEKGAGPQLRSYLARFPDIPQLDYHPSHKERIAALEGVPKCCSDA